MKISVSVSDAPLRSVFETMKSFSPHDLFLIRRLYGILHFVSPSPLRIAIVGESIEQVKSDGCLRITAHRRANQGNSKCELLSIRFCQNHANL